MNDCRKTAFSNRHHVKCMSGECKRMDQKLSVIQSNYSGVHMLPIDLKRPCDLLRRNIFSTSHMPLQRYRSST